MKFCPQCDNMFYLKINSEKEDELLYVCRFCQFKSPADSTEMVQVLNTQVNQRDVQLHHMVNKYTKLDPTLPVMDNMICPRAECQKDKSQADKVLYMRYDEEKLKYLYICCKCDYYW